VYAGNCEICGYIGGMRGLPVSPDGAQMHAKTVGEIASRTKIRDGLYVIILPGDVVYGVRTMKVVRVPVGTYKITARTSSTVTLRDTMRRRHYEVHADTQIASDAPISKGWDPLSDLA